MRHDGEGFTIIEVLVVIAIILILAGMVFKLMPFAVRLGLEAQTKSKLERVAMALNEFKSEYGQYPPGIGKAEENMKYEYENVNLQIPFLRYDHFTVHPYCDTSLLFSYGVCSYLYIRKQGSIEHTMSVNWNDDTERDKNAKAKWEPFIKGIDKRGLSPARYVKELPNIAYTNSVQTIADAWDRTIRYVSFSPYQTYKMWSAGADGKDKTADDINWEGWDK